MNWQKLQRSPDQPLRLRAKAGVAQVPVAVATRMLKRVAVQAAYLGIDFEPERDGIVVDYRSMSPGVYLELTLLSDPVPAGFVRLGALGLPAETVADRAVEDLGHHLRMEAPVDPHLADQPAILLALSTDPAGSRYRTSAITQHLLTHAEVISALLPVDVRVNGTLGDPGEVTVIPRGPICV